MPGRIMRMSTLLDEKHRFLHVDWRKQDHDLDWIRIHDMLDGKRAVDKRLIATVNLKMNKKIGRYDVVAMQCDLVVSDRARAFFLDHVPGQVELIPLRVNGVQFFFLRIQIVAAMDLERSDYDRFKTPPHNVSKIRRYVFDRNLIRPPMVFRVPESPATFFATDDVADAIKAAGLKGFQFVDYENPPEDELIA